MAQDAPADTAGPSSPPPRLPDGWLPQWEGVQRQWYYVQRATGKSQWDIPTEPVVLTPSTTPTSIGTGPSQAPPSRPSTNSPCVTATGNSLVDRMESAADKARFSSPLSSQLNDQPSTSMQGSPGTLGWHSAHNVQHGFQSYTQPFSSGSGGYAAGQFHQTVPGNPDHRPIYTDQGQNTMQNHQQANWGSHAQLIQMLPSGPTADPTTQQYRSFPMDAQQQSQMSAYAASIAYPGKQRSGLVQTGFSPSQPAWQPGGHHNKSSHFDQASSDHYSPSSLSQPFYGSHPIPQTSGQHSGEPASRSSQPPMTYHSGSAHGGNQAEMQRPPGSLSAQPHGNANQGNNIASHPLSRSQSHQSAGFQHDQQDGLAAGSHAQPSVHDYGPQLSNGQSSYQSTDMSRTQLGPGFNSMVFPTAPSAHVGAQHYQNPIVQAGMHHYLQQQPQNNTQSDVTDQHRANYHPHSSQSTIHQGQWTTSASASRIAASDPQFVSGPWASSTPPTSGPPQQPHYG